MVTMSCSPPTLSGLLVTLLDIGDCNLIEGSSPGLRGWFPWILELLLWTSFLLFSYSICFLYFLLLLFCSK